MHRQNNKSMSQGSHKGYQSIWQVYPKATTVWLLIILWTEIFSHYRYPQ